MTGYGDAKGGFTRERHVCGIQKSSNGTVTVRTKDLTMVVVGGCVVGVGTVTGREMKERGAEVPLLNTACDDILSKRVLNGVHTCGRGGRASGGVAVGLCTAVKRAVDLGAGGAGVCAKVWVFADGGEVVLQAGLLYKVTALFVAPVRALPKRGGFAIVRGVPARVFKKSEGDGRYLEVIRGEDGAHDFLLQDALFPVGAYELAA